MKTFRIDYRHLPKGLVKVWVETSAGIERGERVAVISKCGNRRQGEVIAIEFVRIYRRKGGRLVNPDPDGSKLFRKRIKVRLDKFAVDRVTVR